MPQKALKTPGTDPMAFANNGLHAIDSWPTMCPCTLQAQDFKQAARPLDLPQAGQNSAHQACRTV